LLVYFTASLALGKYDTRQNIAIQGTIHVVAFFAFNVFLLLLRSSRSFACILVLIAKAERRLRFSHRHSTRYARSLACHTDWHQIL